MRYITISPEGAYAFYVEGDITPVPAGALKIADAAHERFFSGNQSLFRWVKYSENYARLISISPEEVPRPFLDLTPRQFSLVLVDIGLNDNAILEEIEKIEDVREREIARIDFTKATTFRRDYPLVNEIAGRMGIPPEQVDDLWHRAESY